MQSERVSSLKHSVVVSFVYLQCIYRGHVFKLAYTLLTGILETTAILWFPYLSMSPPPLPSQYVCCGNIVTS